MTRTKILSNEPDDSSTDRKKEIVKNYFWRFAQVSVRSRGGGGTPVPCSFTGLWSQVLSRGYPSPSQGVLGLMYPPPPTGTREPSLGWDWVPALETVQKSEYLRHGGRYASCGHAGGLSCSIFFQQEMLQSHQGSHQHWKTWNTWKNETTFSSQGKVREFWNNVKKSGKSQGNF